MRPKENQSLDEYSEWVIFVPDNEEGIFVSDRRVTTAEFNSSQGPDFNYNERVSVTGEQLEIRAARADAKSILNGNKRIFARYVKIKKAFPGKYHIPGRFRLDGEYLEDREVAEYGHYIPNEPN